MIKYMFYYVFTYLLQTIIPGKGNCWISKFSLRSETPLEYFNNLDHCEMQIFVEIVLKKERFSSKNITMTMTMKYVYLETERKKKRT